MCVWVVDRRGWWLSTRSLVRVNSFGRLVCVLRMVVGVLRWWIGEEVVVRVELRGYVLASVVLGMC